MKKKTKLSASLEDYLEAIYLISGEDGDARSKEIKEHLQVSGPSVTEALQLLAEKGLVNYAPYESITLTPRGKEIARDVLHRHETLRDFFIDVLGIDAKLADEGACKMEHVASANIIDRMVKYTKYIKGDCKGQGCDKVNCFDEYLKTKEDQA
ncbi:MAG TPA: metal-dependent transcriptional regulator [Desulfocapsa sulfexigens]|nr:metal-dependent transcriptional regulator [Desulfocapsa sulfexigens]